MIWYIQDERHCHPANGKTCLIVFCTWVHNNFNYNHMFPDIFGSDPRPWGCLVDVFVENIYIQFYHKICGRSLLWYENRIQSYAHSIGRRLNSAAHYTETCYDDGTYTGSLSYVNIPIRNQRCIGYLDDTLLPTCRPSSNGYLINVQRSFFSGWVRKHGLKAQTVFFPDGMVGHVFVASMRNNNNGGFNLSGMGDYLSHVFREMPNCDPNHRLRYALYCDGIFQSHACLFNRPIGELDPYNTALFRRYNSLRVCIEHSYATYKRMSPIFRYGH